MSTTLPPTRRTLDYVIIGGGISGIAALEELIRVCGEYSSDDDRESIMHRLTLIQAGAHLHRVSTVIQHTERLEEVTGISSIASEVYAKQLESTLPEHIQLRMINGKIISIMDDTSTIVYDVDDESSSNASSSSTSRHTLHYDKVCICTGARPHIFLPLAPGQSMPAQILTIRDASSIAHLSALLATPVPLSSRSIVAGVSQPRSKRVCIVGNGGIAMELVHALQTSQINGQGERLASINANDAVGVTSISSSATMADANDDTLSASATSASTTSASTTSDSLSLPPLDVSWIVADAFIGHTFLDHMASAFLLPSLFPRGDSSIGHDDDDATVASMREEEKIVYGAQKAERHTPTRLITREQSTSSTSTNDNADSDTMTSTQPLIHAAASSTAPGPALGPNWLNQLRLDTNIPKYVIENQRLKAATNATGSSSSSSSSISSSADAHPPVALSLDLCCEVASVHELELADADSYPIALTLTNGKRIECDIVVSATGVKPNTEWAPKELLLSADGGILIDECLHTSLPRVFAAGDCTTLRFSPSFDADHSPARPSLFHPTSRRLWSHAKQVGVYAARAMSGYYDEEVASLGGYNFMLSTHTTSLVGKKVVLLGRYNMQGYTVDEVREMKSTNALRTLVRCTPTDGDECEFIKLHMLHHRIIGAVLIGNPDGETMDMEETMENLMLNQTNMEQFGDFLNDVDVDLADFFD